MKHLFTFFCLSLLALTASAQLTPNVDSRPLVNDIHQERMLRMNDANRTVTCGEDTNLYAIFKATGITLWTIRDGFAFTQVGQYFDASPNNPVTVSGFDFYAVASNGANNIQVPVQAALFLADVSADSTPTGAPLASASVDVDTTFGGGQLSALRKTVNFGAPVTLTDPFVLILSNNSTDTVSLVINSFNNSDGDGECLSLAFAPGLAAWNQGCDLVFQSGASFDVDILIEPFTTFDNTASAGLVDGETCYIAGQEAVTLGGAGLDLLTNRLYNRRFNPYSSFFAEDSAYSWDFMDGNTGIGDTINHVYGTAGVYQPELSTTVLGFVTSCTDVTSTVVTVGDLPVPSFTFTVDTAAGAVSVTNTSTGFETLSYDFGDGNTSTMGAATNTYDSAGTYTITLTAFGCDTSVSTTQEVTIPQSTNIVSLDPAAVSVYPNPSTGLFTVELASGVAGNMNLRVSNVMGQEILRTSATDKTVIDLSNFQAGIYLLQGEVEGRSFTKTLRVE